MGDVVNRSPDAEQGWFIVNEISTLFNGHLQLADESEQLTVSGTHKDMVGVQLVEEVVLDDRGVLAPAAPVAVAAPAPVVHGAIAPGAHPATAPSLVGASDLERSPTVPPAADGPVDLAAEAAAAAAIATESTSELPGVDLALVASLLENLDVGDAPSIDEQLSDDPLMADAAPVIPDNAVAVDGGLLPDRPSYKNPIVVPEGTMLPRRGRAA